MDFPQTGLFHDVGKIIRSAKRCRDEDEDELEELRHDHKKPRTLPFRSSPTTKHTLLFSQSPRNMPKPLLTPAVTPIESSDDEDEKPSYPFPTSLRLQSSQLTMSSTFHIEEAIDSDMDMTESQPSASPAPWNRTITASSSPRSPRYTLLPTPGSRGSHDTVNGGRIPTPIYGHFLSIDTSMDVDTPDATSGTTFSQSMQEMDYQSYLRRRRLPSPISEDEAMDSPTTITGGMLDRLGMGTQTCEPPTPPDRHRKINTSAAAQETVGSKGGKTILSMGYRADCEKCRTRVPGHYNHVIRC